MKPNKTLQKNLEAIASHSPGIAKWIKESPEVEWAEDIVSDSGDPNMLIHAKGSDRIPAYSMKNPMYEALALAKRYKFGPDDITVLMGIGLGYMARAVAKRMHKDHHVIIIEISGGMVQKALNRTNLSKWLKTQNIIIAGPGREAVSFVMTSFEAMLSVESWYLICEAYCNMRPLEYVEIASYVGELINQMQCGTGTVAGSGHKMADNDIESLPYVLKRRGVWELKNLFENKPAITVSTGPSLARNIHILREAQKKVIIIAVGQALRPLLAHDIRPDFACTVDFGEVNMGHFKGMMNCDVPLVAHNRTYAPILKNYQGPMFVSAGMNPGFELTASGIMMEKGSIDQGGSVAHLCLGLAKHMGCNPIILIGQDLALTGQSHFSQADESGTIVVENGLIWWQVKDPRSKLLNRNKGRFPMGVATYVDGYFGKPVLTNVGLASFLTSFQLMIESYSDRNVINSTEGGAAIKGAFPMFLKDAVAKHCKEDLDKSILTPLLSLADNGDDMIERTIPRLRRDIKNLNVIIKNSTKGLDTLDKLEETIKIKNKKKRDGELIRLFVENEKTSTAAQVAASKNMLVQLAIFGASKQIQSKSLKVQREAEHLLKNLNDLKIRTKRNGLILVAAKDASKSLKKSFKEALDILEKYVKTKNVNLLYPQLEEPIMLEDAEECFEAGNWAKPLLEARRFIKRYGNKSAKKKGEMTPQEIIKKAESIRNEEEVKTRAYLEKEKMDSRRIQCRELTNRGQKLARMKKFDEAMDLFRKALVLVPNDENALWGMGTILTFVGEHNKSLKWYKKLMEAHPENLRYAFEYGNVQLRAEKIQEGMRTIGEVMGKTDQFDSFLVHMGDLYNQSNMNEEALVAYDNYLDKFRSDFVAWTKRGLVLKKMDKKKKANESFRKALSIKPNYEMAKLALKGKEIII